MHLSVGLGEELKGVSIQCGHHTLSINLGNQVPQADAPMLGNTALEETTDLEGTGRGCAAQGAPLGAVSHTTLLGPHNTILHSVQLLVGVELVDDGRGH